MTKRILTFAGVIFCVAVAAAVFFRSPPRQPDFAPGTTVRVFLPEDGSTQKIRYERYAEDRVNRTVTEIEYVDGSSEQLSYWENNLPRASVKFSKENDQGQKFIRSKAEFDHRSGQLYTSHQVYRADSTLERSGTLLPDGRYQNSYFFADGKLARQRIFNKDRVFVSEKIFRPDGTLLADVVQGDTDQKEVVLYWPNGARQASYSSNLVNGVNGYFYDEDGTTVVCQFSKTYWASHELYVNSAGVPWQQRMSYSGTGTLTITLLNPDGTPSAVQFWHLRPAADGKPAYKVLSSVSLYHNGERRPYRSISVNSQRNGQPGLADGINAAGQDKNGQQVIDPALLVEPVSSPIPEVGLTEKNAPPLLYDYD